MSWPQAADLGLTGPALVRRDPAEVAAAACAWVVQLCTGPREFHIVLAGGSTPSKMYEHLSREYKTEVDWSRWHVWFGDERAVAPDDEASNYRMADLSLLRNVGIPENQVHRMPADESNLANGASRYNTAVSETIPQLHGMPRFDLVLLGLGEDGHTASLFPGDPALSVQDRACTTSRAANEPRNRLTLTYAAINSAAHVAFLVTGSGKGAALRAVQERSVPAAAVKPQDGELVWFLDQAAVDSLQSAG
jgi:6-phosphogluconolactonase